MGRGMRDWEREGMRGELSLTAAAAPVHRECETRGLIVERDYKPGYVAQRYD